jgi:lipoate-protein ligase B
VTVFETNRGGRTTYHGPGQIVGYPIIKLSPDREDVHRYVRDLEEVLIRTMRDFDIEAFRIKGLTGAHTERGKVAAIGVHIACWITTHGFALNVNTDLSYFDLIVPCEGEPVTSMAELLGREIELSAVEDRIIEHFAEGLRPVQRLAREPCPETFEVALGFRDQLAIGLHAGDVRLLHKRGRRRENAVFLQHRFNRRRHCSSSVAQCLGIESPN